MEHSRRTLLAAAWIVVCFLLIYLPDCGLGFLKDDYSWIETSRIHGTQTVWRLFREAPMGFYRPLVSLSFGINNALSGLNPQPYGLTNLTLALLTAIAIGWLIWRLGFTPPVALFGASAWLLNFHGIAMAVLWTSGRTSLLGTLFAVLTACAFAAGRPVASGFFMTLALFSKEEPLFLPLVFALWTLIDFVTRDRSRMDRSFVRSGLCVAATAVAAGVYLVVRFTTPAFTVATMPEFYSYRLDALPANLAQYFDRSLTVTLSLLFLGSLFMVWRKFALTPFERSTILKGVIWLVLGFALTAALPIRSSLYVCLPSVGSSFILAAVGSAEWRGIERRRTVLVGLLVLPFVLVPAYWARNLEITQEQRLATNVLQILKQRLAAAPISRLVLYDHPDRHPALGDAFGDALPIALRVSAPAHLPAEVFVVPESEAATMANPPDTLELFLTGETVSDRLHP